MAGSPLPSSERWTLWSARLPDHDPPVGDVAGDDPPTTAALRAMRRRARRPLFGSLIAVIISLAAARTADAIAISEDTTSSLEAAAFVSVPVLIAVAGTHRLRTRSHRWARTTLATGQWRLVETLLLVGAPIDDQVPVVAIVEPSTGRMRGTWLVDQCGARGWPTVGEREWAYLAVAGNGSHAVLAPVDRAHLMTLRAQNITRSAAPLHEWAWMTVRVHLDLPPSEAASGHHAEAPATWGVLHADDHAVHWPNRPLTAQQRVAISLAMVAVAAGFTGSEGAPFMWLATSAGIAALSWRGWRLRQAAAARSR